MGRGSVYDAIVERRAVLCYLLSSFYFRMHIRTISIQVPMTYLACVVDIGIVMDDIPIACIVRLHGALQHVIVIDGIVRSLLTRILYGFLESVRGTDRVVSIEIVTEVNIWND